MSACNIITEPRRAIVWTDAAVYDGDDIILGFTTKCFPVAGMKAVVTGRGAAFVPGWFADVLGRVGRSFDDVVDRGELIIEQALDAIDEQLERLPHRRLNIIITGWSDRENRPKCLVFDNTVPEGKRFQEMENVIAPEIEPEEWKRVRAIFSGRRKQDCDMQEIGVPLMEAQRRTEGAEAYGKNGRFNVGGYVTETLITAAGVMQRIVHRWPEDRVGERIRPAAAPAVLASSNVVPMNRQQRRAAERQRRTVAA